MPNHNLVFSMDGDYFIYRIGRANAEKKAGVLTTQAAKFGAMGSTVRATKPALSG